MIETLIYQENGCDIVREIEAQDIKPVSVFGPYIYKGELSALFGDTNTGKSILANDIAMFVSGGESCWPGFVSPNLPSLYIDLEMTRTQWGLRYKGASGFIPDKFRRAEVDLLGGSENEILNSIVCEITQDQDKADAPKFIVIDNYTVLGNSIASAKFAKHFVKTLKRLKDKFELTFLIIAHSVKKKPGKPIENDDLGGSKMLVNFLDSAFAIGSSNLGSSVKYIKQTKCRMGEKLSDVQTVEIKSSPYVHLIPTDRCDELEHITKKCVFTSRCSIKPEMEPTIIQMRRLGTTIEDIAEELNLSKSSVGRYLKAMGI